MLKIHSVFTTSLLVIVASFASNSGICDMLVTQKAASISITGTTAQALVEAIQSFPSKKIEGVGSAPLTVWEDVTVNCNRKGETYSCEFPRLSEVEGELVFEQEFIKKEEAQNLFTTLVKGGLHSKHQYPMDIVRQLVSGSGKLSCTTPVSANRGTEEARSTENVKPKESVECLFETQEQSV